jgi:hypothetical protein
MNVEIGTEAPIFLFWEYLFQIFGILSLQCYPYLSNKEISANVNDVTDVIREVPGD